MSDHPDTRPVLNTVEEYRALIDNLHAGLVVHGPDTGILLCNGTSAELLGLSMEQMTGKMAIDPAWCFTAADGSPMRLEDYPVNQVLTTRRPIRNLLVGVNRPVTGDRIWVLCNAYPVMDASGELSQIVVTFIDVSDQRRAEEDKARLEVQLRQSQRMEAVGKLAGGVAHDFNNLITTMTGYCDLLLDELEEQDNRRNLVTQVRKSADRAASLTRQLLAFSRKQVLEPRLIDLNRVVRDMDKLLRRLIGEDVALVSRLAPAMRLTYADPGQIEQVVMNLAVNARDAMPEGGTLTIETEIVELDEDYVRERPEVEVGPHVALSMSDTGYGMDESTRSRIFEPFYTTKDVGKGTGLGLSTVYGIVKQSGGHIWVYSEPGRGATFKIYFPLMAAEGEGGERPSPPEGTPISGGRGETILVVEDDEDVRFLTTRVLRKQGYDVHEAECADDAMRALKRIDGELHLLLTDVVMPGASGPQLARQVGVLRPMVRVLYMSGYTDNAIVHHGVLNAGTDFLPKPFTAKALARKVREILDRV
jgi:two-component system, cell cycle sensor histidine kinase and response regulator CckA